jgi:hypothetical protein
MKAAPGKERDDRGIDDRPQRPGLDPAAGFMHGAQKAKMAPRSPLVLDLMEPRQIWRAE